MSGAGFHSRDALGALAALDVDPGRRGRSACGGLRATAKISMAANKGARAAVPVVLPGRFGSRRDGGGKLRRHLGRQLRRGPSRKPMRRGLPVSLRRAVSQGEDPFAGFRCRAYPFRTPPPLENFSGTGKINRPRARPPAFRREGAEALRRQINSRKNAGPVSAIRAGMLRLSAGFAGISTYLSCMAHPPCAAAIPP